MRYDLQQAADLAEASYQTQDHSSLRSRIVEDIDEADVQAQLLDNGLLLISGSNSAQDYLRYNLRPLRIGARQYRVKSAATGQAMGGRWHQGFLAHAMVIHRRLDRQRPRFIIGHSLGAAAAQVLSLLWRVPAVCFAAPRLYAGGRPVSNERLSLCIWRTDDPVGSFPGDGFEHVGRSVALGKSRSTGMLNHSMKHYKRAIREPHYGRVLPTAWPI